MQYSYNIVKVSDVVGKKVIDKEKENLGKIEEIILDKLNGQVKYVVLSFGGFLGMGDKLFALPWKSLSFDPQEDVIVLAVAKERLKNAPGFDKDQWPNVADPAWAKSIDIYYNY